MNEMANQNVVQLDPSASEAEIPQVCKGIHTFVRPLEREDCEKIAGWEPYDDVQSKEYNLPAKDKAGWDEWFRSGASGENALFAIEDTEQNLVGLIRLEDIDTNEGTARIHLQINPAYRGQKLGTYGLRTFMELYFGMWKRETLTAALPGYNQRGRRCLERSSFTVTDHSWEPEPRGMAVISMPELAPYRRFFRVVGNQTEVQTMKLEVSRLTWSYKRDHWKKQAEQAVSTRQPA